MKTNHAYSIIQYHFRIREFDVASAEHCRPKVAARKHADRADLPVPAAAICREQVLQLLRLECFAAETAQMLR